MEKWNPLRDLVYGGLHRSGTPLGALIGFALYPVLCLLLFIGVTTNNFSIISGFIRFDQPMFFWVFKFWHNVPMWFVEHHKCAANKVSDAQILKSEHITLDMFEKIMDHKISKAPWGQNPVLLNSEFLRVAFINNPDVYASYNLDEESDVLVQRDAAEHMKFVLNSHTVISRFTDPEALKSAYRKFDEGINTPEEHVNASQYYWVIHNILLNPHASDEIVEACLTTKFGSFYNTLEGLILRPVPLTTPMLTHLAEQENIVDMIFEVTRHKPLTLTLPVLMAGYASALKDNTGQQDEAKQLIVDKLEVNNWGAALNFLLRGQGYETEELETLPNSWKESLLPTVFPYIKPSVKVGF